MAETAQFRGQEQMYELFATVATEAMGIGKSSDILTVLGGKASCRRKFVINVHLVDRNENLVNKDMSIVASVSYAHDHSPVIRDEKPFLAEPPLFTTFNGVEFPAQDRPSRMVSGRASFKLAISLLSSKCDNRLFCICFTPQIIPGSAPICQPCYSKPIRSISRKRTPSPLLSLPLTFTNGVHSSSGKKIYIDAADDEGGQKLDSPSSSDTECQEISPNLGQPLQSSSRSSSVTSIHQANPYKRHAASQQLCSNPALCSSTSNFIGKLSTNGEKFGKNEPSSRREEFDPSSFRRISSELHKMAFDGSSLSLRLSPTESGSRNSGTLTSESSIANKDPDHFQHSSPDESRSPSAPSVATTKPFRPYASVGACKLPQTETSNGLSLNQTLSSLGDGYNLVNALFERFQQLQNVPLTQKESTASGARNDKREMNNNPVTAISLEQEEKSLHCVEVSLQEVTRVLQKRKEELRIKRRRLLEDEARMHSIVFQSSSWIESLSGRFNL
ncbi:hypothetical protein O6H91_05G092500 [Diphasiastrum complanatum]|uniref:Uncharacterized protein n=2 Tax=Diphasiastrum complanatum TaxID=34168 RepID=A0ACC2DQT7_DIPCM|nr:hypothetical protein O6H91_05G091800 [Diphasiastrum complanatum]KAJ7556663.1 hypothetical protein O6H91_05G092500 [Diphasiastrum complanatum]